jgi:uncharacterized iron-regulated protein
MRLIAASCLLLLAGIAALAQDKPEDIRTSEVTRGRAQFLRVDYMRELWVGLPAKDLPADQLLKALLESCDDTTAVAVLDVAIADGVATTSAEKLATQAVAARAALGDVKRALKLDPAVTRVVMVGVLDSCALAARVVSAKGTGVEGVTLIDPAVGDLDLPEELPAAGVDVLLHPRSDDEWLRDESEVRKRLQSWGRSARVIRSGGHFDNLAQRIGELRRHTRGYTVLLDGEESALTAGDLASRLAEYDVIFVGELHGNPGAHRVQLEMLRHFSNDKRKLALATEQFERDVQTAMDNYLAGSIDEAEMLKTARPWPNHADYRPLVELCKAKGIHVIAGNIPRRLASRINKESPDAMETFSEEERAWTARELQASPGAYRDNFMKAMGGMAGHAERLDNMYAAQCIKDDTMAESVADWMKANNGARVLHINGNFHSAGGLGVPEKLAALMPDLKIAMVTCVPLGDAIEAEEDEWIVTVPAPRPR